MSFLGSVFGASDYGTGFNQAQGIGGALGNAQNMAAQLGAQQSNWQAKQAAYNAAQQHRIQSGNFISGGAQVQNKAFDPNEIEAYQIPLSQLVTLWQVRYGDKWVEMREAAATEFFDHAVERLSHNNLLEEWRGWARIKEGV